MRHMANELEIKCVLSERRLRAFIPHHEKCLQINANIKTLDVGPLHSRKSTDWRQNTAVQWLWEIPVYF